MSKGNGNQHLPESDDDLSRLYRLTRSEYPPPELDQKILAKARHEVDRFHLSSPFTGGWKVPAAMAAVLIIGLSIMFQLEQQSEISGPPEIYAPPSDSKSLKERDYPAEVSTDVSSPTRKSTEDQSEAPTVVKQPRVESELQFEPSEDLKKFMKQSPAAAPEMIRPTPSQSSAISSQPKFERRYRSQAQQEEGSVLQETEKLNVQPRETLSIETTGLSAKDWYAAIKQLVAEGNILLAHQELEKFLVAYPDYPVHDLQQEIQQKHLPQKNLELP